MQIEDDSGKVLSQAKSNKAGNQVVKEIYMCPTFESDDELLDNDSLGNLDVSY